MSRFPFRRWLDDCNAAASVEFVFVAPAMFMIMAIVTFAGQGFELQRKVTLTMRTLTDIVAQQSDVGTSSTTYTYSQILAAASLVVAPYDSTQVSMTIAEIQATSTTSGKVIWRATSGPSPSALTVGETVTFPSTMLPVTGTYLIYGTVNYNYSPLQIWFSNSPMTLSDSIYMSPRASSSIACSGCPS